ncbi:MAG TPA: FapA family protein, partial [Bacillota bacterium]|nr:FapA family protein [Bacillota bacterium]
NWGGVGKMSDNSNHDSKGNITPAQQKAKVVEQHNDINDRIAGIIGLKKVPDLKVVTSKTSSPQNGHCRVSVSSDFMSAYFSLEPPQGGGDWPTLEEALLTIKEAGITTGVNQAAVKEAIDSRTLTEILFAKGALATDGTDAEFRILHELVDLHRVFIGGLVEDEHGRVDYHLVKTLNSVEKGDLVAEKIPAVPGSNGFDLRGQVIPAVQGRDREVKLGKNLTWDDQGLKVYATSGGKPILINKCLHVLPVHEVEGNVNFHTGNINFAGNVVIQGDVESGFKVEAEGEIVIMGGVEEGAEISAGGKLSIRGSVFGMDKTKIECGGDFFAKELERVHLKCKGTVLVKDAIMHCQVNAENKVIVEGGKGWIVGGAIHAGESIEARTFGSRMGINTELEISHLGRHSAPEAASHEDMTQAGSMNERDFPQEANPNPKNVQESPPQTTRGRIKIAERMYPGVRVKIGPHISVIHNEMSGGILYYTQEGDLRLIPIK